MFDKKTNKKANMTGEIGRMLAAAVAVAGVVQKAVLPGVRTVGGWFGKKQRTYVKLASHLTVLPKRERERIREEIRKGIYCFEDTVRVETMADTGVFVRQGTGKLIQTPKGIRLECRFYGEEYTLIRSARTMDRLMVSHNEQEAGECIDLPAETGCFRCYLSDTGSLPKLAYATEEIHRQILRRL